MSVILVPAVARPAVVVRSDSIAMRQTIPSIHPFLGISCACPQFGVVFGGGGRHLTCCRSQLILEGVDFIVEHAIFFLLCCYGAC